MTVAELIEELKKYPQDAEVIVHAVEDGDRFVSERFHYDEEERQLFI